MPCSLFVRNRSGKGVLVNIPLNKWIKASDILSEKAGHTTKDYHRKAVCDMDTFESTMMNPDRRITSHIDSTVVKRVTENRNILKKISQAILFCARQCIALRGNEESLTTVGDAGKFLAFLAVQASSDGLVWLYIYTPKMKTATYVSPQSQNELIEVIGKRQILNEMLDELREARFYAVLADEVTPHNQEQLALCVRFVDAKSNIRE